MDDDVDNNELECRVCRNGPEPPSRPLYSPCHCSGSIGLVHQDCLEAWLDHSKKEVCELCGLKYQFSPQYADDTPTVLPLSIVVGTTAKKILKDFFPFVVRIVAVCLVWLGVVPLITSQMYRMWIRLDTIPIEEVYERLKRDIILGIVLTAFIVLSFVVMVSANFIWMLLL